MKLPMNSITVSSVNSANTTSTDESSSGGGGVASSSAHRTTASSAVIGNRYRLGYPPDHGEGQDRQEPVLVSVQIERDQQHHCQDDRPEEQAYRAALALEALLGL